MYLLDSNDIFLSLISYSYRPECLKHVSIEHCLIFGAITWLLLSDIPEGGVSDTAVGYFNQDIHAHAARECDDHRQNQQHECVHAASCLPVGDSVSSMRI